MKVITSISVSIILVVVYSTIALAQPELDIQPNRVEFEDLFNRFDYTFLINKGDEILTIDSIAYNDSIYILGFENNLQLPFSIVPDDSIKMTVTLSGFYYITVTDTLDTMYVFNNGIASPEPLRIRINFFEDEYGEIECTVKDSLTPVENATLYFFYNGIYLLATAQTDTSGKYRITLPEGEYTIGVEKDGYYSVFYDSTYDPYFAELIDLHLGSLEFLNFNLKKIDNSNLSVSGQIIDSTSGNNVNKGIIIVRGGNHVPIGKPNGNPLLDTMYTFAGFIKPDGSYKVYTQLPDYFYLQAYTNNFLPGYYNDEGIASVYWQNADSLLIDTIIADKNISLLRDSSYGYGSISGNITFSNMSLQEDYEGITVLAKNLNNGSLYSYNFGKQIGDYKVTNIPFGTYELVAQKIGFDNATSQIITIDPASNQITGVNLNFIIVDSPDEVYIPDDIQLYQNYPNPFNPVTNISFYLPSQSTVKLQIINILGESVTTLINNELSAGFHSTVFDGNNFASGIYFIVLESKEKVLSKKMILLK